MAEPTVTPTSPLTLALLAAGGALAAAVAKLAFDRVTGSAPSPGPAAVWIGVLAVFTGGLAVAARRSIRRRPDTVDAEQTVRWLALAKAAAAAGALFTGGFVAYAAASAGHLDTVAGGPRFWWSVAAAITSAALLAAGLWLEQSLRVPPPPGDDEKPTSPTGDDMPTAW